MIVTLAVAASASASPLPAKKIVTRDVTRASSVFPTLAAPWSPTAKAIGDIFYDGFEGPTSPWQVAGPPGTPTWGPTTYRAAAGSVSAYCAGSTIQAPGPYANNMQAWLWTGPINLAGVTAATLEYQLYLVSEYEHDAIGVYVSLDDNDYYLATGWWGNSSGWTTDSVDLTAVPTLGNVCGQSTVYVAFIFTSDVLTTYEGAYVDEVRITAGGAPPTAAITSLTPNHGVTGTTVTIAGTNLGTSGTVRFGTTSASTSAWSATSTTCTVPASLSPGVVNVTVTPAGGTASNALSFTVDEPPSLKLASWTISGQPLVVPYNGTVTVSGTLRDFESGALLAGRVAELCWTLDPTDYDSWVSLGETSSASGQFTTQVPSIQRRTYFSWYFDGDAQYWWEWSEDLKIMARAKLVPPPIPKTVRRGVRVVAWGTLQPQHSAAANAVNHTKASFYRYSNGKWRFVATLWAKAYRNTTSATQYKMVVSSFGKAGRWRVKAIHSDADHAKTTSAWRYFRVT